MSKKLKFPKGETQWASTTKPLSIDKNIVRAKKAREYAAQLYANRTGGEKNIFLAKEQVLQKARRKNMNPSERKKYLARNRRNVREYRARMTPEQKMEMLAKQRNRHANFTIERKEDLKIRSHELYEIRKEENKGKE